MSNDAAAGTMMIVFGVVYLAIIVLFLLVMTLWAMGQQVIFTWSGFGDADRNLLLFKGEGGELEHTALRHVPGGYSMQRSNGATAA